MKRAGTTVGDLPGFVQLAWTYRIWSVRYGVSSLNKPLPSGASRRQYGQTIHRGNGATGMPTSAEASNWLT